MIPPLPVLPLPPIPTIARPRVFAMKDREYADAAWELFKERGGGWIPEDEVQARARQIAARPKPPPLPPLPKMPAIPLPPLPVMT